MAEEKIIHIKFIGIEEGTKRLTDLNKTLIEQQDVLKALKKEKDKDIEAISRQTLEITKTKAETRLLIKEISKEITEREKRASQIDREVEKRAKLIMTVENENRRREKMIEAQSQKETIAAQKAEQQAQKKIGYINELRIEVQKLEQQYFRLNEAELKGAKGKDVLNSLTQKRAELKGLQQEYGNYSMNVGNYSSATKMMAINMSQVLREMPNFAISARIGIMSLTNNLPMLAENIKQVAAEQKVLNQQFKAGLIDAKPESTVKMLMKSMIGLNGIMALGMVLFQVFGTRIIDWVADMFKAKDATDSLTESQLGLKTSMEVSREAMKNGGEYKQAVTDINKLSTTLKEAKGNTDLEKQAVNEYNKTLGVTFGKVKNVDEALRLIEKNKNAYIEAMKQMAFANAFFAQSAEDVTKAMEVGLKTNAELVGESSAYYMEEISKIDKIAASTKRRLQELKAGGASEQQIKVQTDLVAEYEKKQFDIRNAYNEAANKERNKQLGLITKHQNKTEELAEEHYKKYTDAFKSNNWTIEDETKKSGKKRVKDLTAQFDTELKLWQVRNQNIDKNLTTWLKGISDMRKLERESYGMSTVNDDIEDSDRALKAQQDKQAVLKENQANFLSDSLEIAKGNLDAEAEIKKQMLDKQMQDELSAKYLTEEQKVAITQKFAEAEKEIEKNKFMAKLDMAAQVAGGLADLLGRETKAGKFAAAAQVSITGGQDAFTTGSTAAKYFAAGNIPMGILAGVQTGIIVAKTAKAISDIYAVDTDKVAGGGDTTKTTVTEKFHTGTYQPSTKSQEQEITRTLLTTERILSPQQTGLFDSIVNNVQSLGGADNVVGGVGMNGISQFDTMAAAFSTALNAQKAPVVIWKDYDDAMSKKAQFEQNRTL